MAKKNKRKNLRKVDGGWQNKHGVVFTSWERQKLRNSVKESNRLREQAIQAYTGRNIVVAGEDKGVSNNQLWLMGKHPDFILTEQKYNFQNFKTRREFEQALDKQARIQSGEYIRDRAKLYKRNFLKSLKETYAWDDVKDIYMKVQMMDPIEYITKVSEDEVLEIRYVPSDVKDDGRPNQLRAALGMKLKEEWFDEEIE